jgi:hypothetical protein
MPRARGLTYLPNDPLGLRESKPFLRKRDTSHHHTCVPRCSVSTGSAAAQDMILDGLFASGFVWNAEILQGFSFVVAVRAQMLQRQLSLRSNRPFFYLWR